MTALSYRRFEKRLVDADTGLLYDARPLGYLGDYKLVEVIGAARNNVDTLIDDPRFKVGHLYGASDRSLQRGHNAQRRPRRRQYSVPGAGFHPRESGFRHGRYVGHDRRATPIGDGERAQSSTLDMLFERK